MGFAHVGYQAAVGLYYLYEGLDFAWVVGSHLDDGDVVLLGKTQEGLGHTDMVVEVALSVEYVILLAEHGGNKFLSGGFAVSTRNAYYWRVQRTTMLTSKLLQGGEHIIYYYVSVILGILCLVNYGIGAPFIECRLSIRIAIKRVALEGKEDASLGTVATVGGHDGVF